MKNKLDIQTQISDAIFKAQTRNSASGKILEDSVQRFSLLGMLVCLASFTTITSLGVAIFMLHKSEIVRVLSNII